MELYHAVVVRPGNGLLSFGVVCLGELEWMVDVGRYTNKICRGSLASSSLEELVSGARLMEIVASAA